MVARVGPDVTHGEEKVAAPLPRGGFACHARGV